jgi:DNA-binding response OmpR family regulator
VDDDRNLTVFLSTVLALEGHKVVTASDGQAALDLLGHQATSRGNAAFVQYIPRTLTLVRSNMARNPRFSRLRELLASHLDELR